MDVLVISLSVVSLLSTIIGLSYLGDKNARGFLFFTLSLFFQGVMFFMQSNWFLVFQMFILVVFNLITYLKWTEDNK